MHNKRKGRSKAAFATRLQVPTLAAIGESQTVGLHGTGTSR